MRLAITLGLSVLLSVSPVLAEPINNAATGLPDVVATPGVGADECGWSASLEEDEGGPVMVASSCESDTEFGPALRLFCGEGISIRYNGLGALADPPLSSTLVLTSGEKSLSADVVFEEMDGAYAAYVEKGSAIISLLKSGDKIGVTFKGLDLPPRIISLKGSSTAIDTLMNACNLEQ